MAKPFLSKQILKKILHNVTSHCVFVNSVVHLKMGYSIMKLVNRLSLIFKDRNISCVLTNLIDVTLLQDLCRHFDRLPFVHLYIKLKAIKP